MKPACQTRVALASDADIIATHRARMYLDMGALNLRESQELERVCRPYLGALLRSGQYLGWLVEDGERGIVAGAGVTLRELAPHPGCYRPGRLASIGNVYTNPSHRRQGLARGLMETILQWCEQNTIDQVTLSASQHGRPLYQALGFLPTEEMRFARPHSR